MDKKLYDLMDWPEIEAIVYSEHDNPHSILGAHSTSKGTLVQCFIPTAVKVELQVLDSDTRYEMELVDEAGFFAVLLPKTKKLQYKYAVTYDNGTTQVLYDPYAYGDVLDEKELKRFNTGNLYNVYEFLGAHVTNIDGVDGVSFAVWAPNAIRVSVVGDYNLWDGRRHQMKRVGDTGIFELFIPELTEDVLYKYEIKAKGGLTFLKADPYANYAELRPATASIVYNIDRYKWTDSKWIEKRKKTRHDELPTLIYEVHLGSWKRPSDGREFYNYREIAPLLVEYIKEMGYTHVELMPIMEYPFDGSWGYQVTGYYAPTSRYGNPEDFMYFVDYLHKNDVGVILDWVPAHFPRDTFGLAGFDGTCLYEHPDKRKGEHPHWGTLIYNYESPQVRNFLIANALFWVKKYHIDGIRIDAVASMLYLDYGKNAGEWCPNIYGGNENLEAVEFFKQLSKAFEKDNLGASLIAEESTAWPKVTERPEDGGLGFDYKWNMGWMNDFIEYIKYDPYFRSHHYGELTFSMVYNYSEKFVLVLSHDEVVHLKGSMINKMPGDTPKKKFANLRVAYSFMMAHPGKKLLFMGQDIGQYTEWAEDKSVQWECLANAQNQELQLFVKDLFALYKKEPAFYKLDYDPAGFEWINNISARENIVVFARKTEKKEDTVIIVCNFAPVLWQEYKIGVPYSGKYKEIFNSDSVQYGGEDNLNKRLKQSKKDECDTRENSIRITVPPLGMTVLKYTPVRTKKATTSEEIIEAASEDIIEIEVEVSEVKEKELKKKPKKTLTTKKKAVTEKTEEKAEVKTAPVRKKAEATKTKAAEKKAEATKTKAAEKKAEATKTEVAEKKSATTKTEAAEKTAAKSTVKKTPAKRTAKKDTVKKATKK